jgi:Zn-dependent protease with chaperone function
VLISDAAEFILNSNELQSALRHELAHVRRRDNLKKLLLHFTAFPDIGGLESAWLQATEMAADEAAVSSAGEALDLAAALIKLSRLGPLPQAPAMSTALVQAPLAAVNARIERLIAWNGQEDRPAFPLSPMPVVSVIVATVAVLVVTYSQLLVRIHTASEWLVR